MDVFVEGALHAARDTTGVGLSSIARLGQQQLHILDAPLAEATLAVAEVEIPQAAKALVVAEVRQTLGGLEEALAPQREGRGVVGGDVLQVHLAQVGHARQLARDHLQRGQAAAGEDVGVDEALARLLDLVGAVVDHDRLQQHRAVVAQQLRAAAEVGREVLPADGLDHLDRDELVVAALEVAVVLEQDRHAILQPARAHALGREGVLFAGDRRGRHPAAVVLGRVDGKPAPAGADLQHVVGGAEVELRADPLELRERGLFEGGLAASRRSRRSTSSSGRGTARTARCRGRSARRSAGASARSCCARSQRIQRCTGIKTGASTRRRLSSERTLSAARRVSATRSEHSQRPSM